MKEFKAFWQNYANFTDRTTVRGYWMAWLIYMAIGLVLPLLSLMFAYAFALGGGGGRVGFLSMFTLFAVLWNIAILIPSIAITVRRLRDAGIHWAFIFIALVPCIGLVAHIIMLCMPSKDTELNRDVPVV